MRSAGTLPGHPSVVVVPADCITRCEAVLVHAGGQAATYGESLLCCLKSIPVSQGRRFRRRWRRWDGTQVLYRNFTILFSSTIDLAQSIAIRFQFRIQKGNHNLACFLISGTPGLLVPPVECVFRGKAGMIPGSSRSAFQN